MDSSALKVVLRVQSQGSIAGTARALDMDPEEGRTYLNRIAPVMEELDAAREEANGVRTQPAGHLRVTASVAFSYQILVHMLPGFCAKFPDITVDLRASDTNLDLLEDGIDLAIRLEPASHPSLVSTRLMHTRFKAVASPAYLQRHSNIESPQDLSRLNCLQLSLPGLQNLWRFRLPDGTDFELPLHGNLQSSSPLVLRQAAISGMGVALIAHWMINEELQQGSLVEVFPEYQCLASTEVWALCPNTTYIPRRVQAMIDYLVKHI